MVELIDEKFHLDTLKCYENSAMVVWLYCASMRRMMLRLDVDGNDPLYIVLMGCKHFVGPFYIEACFPSISEGSFEESRSFSFFDQRNEFKLDFDGGCLFFKAKWIDQIDSFEDIEFE